MTFIQLSVTFFSLDVNESDVKERSAPGVGLLHTRRPPDFTLHGAVSVRAPASSHSLPLPGGQVWLDVLVFTL